jgi:PKD repeat protein
MMKKQFLVFNLILSFCYQTYSQNCGTVPTVEQLKFMNEIQSAPNGKSSAFGRTQLSIIKIPLKIHAARPSNGVGGGLTDAQLINVFSKLNGYYANSGIEFFQFGAVNNIDNDAYYNLNSANEGGIAVPNDVANVINVYFTNTLITNGTPLCGYTRFPPSSDRVFTTYSCTFGGTTLEHELGHYFTLFHTHGTTNTGTTDELVNGSNCQNAGDRLCDTPADPNLTGKVNASCIYTGVDRDANGQLYSPNVRNIMAYSRDACQDFFSSGQYDRIRNGFENGRSYLLIQTDDFSTNIFTQTRQVCKGSTVSFLAVGSGATSWSWEFEGGTPTASAERNPKIKYNESGNFNVKLTARASNGQTVTSEKIGFITVTDPLDIALTGDINYGFDTTLPTTFTLNNPDQSITYNFSNYDRAGGNSGSVYINNFNYSSDRSFNYDDLISPFLDNKGVRGYRLSFDVSYSPRQGGLDGDNLRPDAFDSLAVTVYNKCGSKPVRLWKQGGAELQTSPIQLAEFFPSSSQWKSISLDVDVFDEEFTQFNWSSTSVNGNNLYIDNISIQPDYSLNSPSNFRASNVSSNGITLRWSDNSTNELNFVIERSVNEGTYVELAKVPKNGISFVDALVEVGTRYKYRIYASGFQNFKSLLTAPISVEFFVTSLNEPIELKIYPNPVTNELNIENNEEEPCTIQVFSSLGLALPEIYVGQNSRSEFSFGDLSQGLYILRASYPSKTHYSKIVKLK